MADPIQNPPTLIGFIAFGRSIMGIPVGAMADNDPGWNYAFNLGLGMVPLDLNAMNPDMYTVCVYNYSGSLLLQWQQDYVNQVFFADARQAYGMNTFTAGVISSASDNGTSESMTVGQGLSNLDLASLQRAKDPYGRQALAIMMSLGTLWGLT